MNSKREPLCGQRLQVNLALVETPENVSCSRCLKLLETAGSRVDQLIARAFAAGFAEAIAESLHGTRSLHSREDSSGVPSGAKSVSRKRSAR